MEAAQKDGNAFQIYFEKLIKEKEEINIEIFTTPLQNRSYYYQQTLGYFSKYFGDMLNLKIYCALDFTKNEEINPMLPEEKEEAKRLLIFEKHFKNKFEDYLIERSKNTFPVNFPFLSKNYDLKTTLKSVQVSEEELQPYFNNPELIQELNLRSRVASRKLDSLRQKHVYFIENQDSMFSKNKDFSLMREMNGMPRYYLQASLAEVDIKSPTDSIDRFTLHILENPILLLLNGEPLTVSQWDMYTNYLDTRERYKKSGWNCPSGKFSNSTRDKPAQVRFHVLSDLIEYDIYPLDLETKVVHNEMVLYQQAQKFNSRLDSTIELKNLVLGDSIEIFAKIEKKGYHKECPDFYKKTNFYCPTIEFVKEKNTIYFSLDKGKNINHAIQYQLNLNFKYYLNNEVKSSFSEEFKTYSGGVKRRVKKLTDPNDKCTTGKTSISYDKVCITGKILREVDGQMEEATVDQNNCKENINRCFDLKNLKN